MSFLPDDYQSPSTGSENYMKIENGENKLRILSAPILGFEEWFDNKPLRYRMSNKPLTPKDPKCVIRHFWSFICWNYQEERIQILNLTQATLRKKLETLSKDEDWGAPYFYDVKIIKSGEGKETKYDINPLPHKQVRQDIINAFHAKPCYLEALFDSQDPFALGWPSFTPGVFSKDEQTFDNGTIPLTSPGPKYASNINTISTDQVRELNMIIEECNPMYLETLMAKLAASKTPVKAFSEMSDAMYRAVLQDARKNREQYIEQQRQEQELGF